MKIMQVIGGLGNGGAEKLDSISEKLAIREVRLVPRGSQHSQGVQMAAQLAAHKAA